MDQLRIARARYSQVRVDDLRSAMSELQVLRQVSDLVVFAAGSFGRYEASEHSDVDLFMTASVDTPVLPQEIKDALVELVPQECGFPPLTRDGEYLNILPLTMSL